MAKLIPEDTTIARRLDILEAAYSTPPSDEGGFGGEEGDEGGGGDDELFLSL